MQVAKGTQQDTDPATSHDSAFDAKDHRLSDFENGGVEQLFSCPKGRKGRSFLGR